VAGDIKSGADIEGEDDESEGKLKRHYAVQLALYTDILGQMGFSSPGHFPFIWDIHGQEIAYDLETPISKRNGRSLWNFYEECLDSVMGIKRRAQEPLAALCAVCKLCHWRSHCRAQLKGDDDLTLIPELGRAKRDVMYPYLKTVHDLAQSDSTGIVQGKRTIFPRISANTIRRFQERARLLTTTDAKPYLKETIQFPDADIELFYDVETDPMRDCCYLHGFIERKKSNLNRETYDAFVADQPNQEQERGAFAWAMDFMRKRRPFALYYYSHYELPLRKDHLAEAPGAISRHRVGSRDRSVVLFGLGHRSLFRCCAKEHRVAHQRFFNQNPGDLSRLQMAGQGTLGSRLHRLVPPMG